MTFLYFLDASILACFAFLILTQALIGISR